MYKFIIATGGTGGHIFPAVALLDQLKQRKHQCLVVADARFRNFERYIPGGIDYKIIWSGSLSGNIFKQLWSLVKIAIGIVQAFIIILKYKPQMVISFGGYISFPTMVAALVARVPLLIHEQNSIIGKANKVLLKQANLVCASFQNTRGIGGVDKGRFFVTGSPVRKEVLEIRTKEYLPIKPDGEINILVLGGSQGARILSWVVPRAITSLDEKTRSRIRVHHQCRREDMDDVSKKYKKFGVIAEVETFFSDIPHRLAQAHLVICRSGASTIAELTAVGRPAVLVPLATSADDHQCFNAKALSDKNAAWTIEEKDFSIEFLERLLTKFITKPDILIQAANNMKSQFIDSNKSLLKLIETFCSKAE